MMVQGFGVQKRLNGLLVRSAFRPISVRSVVTASAMACKAALLKILSQASLDSLQDTCNQQPIHEPYLYVYIMHVCIWLYDAYVHTHTSTSV